MADPLTPPPPPATQGGNVEDIFSDNDPTLASSDSSEPAAPMRPQPAPIGGSSVPKLTPSSPTPPMQPDVADPMAGAPGFQDRGNAKKAMVLVAIIVVVVLLLIVGGIVLWRSMRSEPQTIVNVTNTPSPTNTTLQNRTTNTRTNTNTNAPVTLNTNTDTNTNPSADTDGDGLRDSEEKDLGTSLTSSDTDRDGLFDLEEARVYKTDPKKADTDGDTYSDGVEVQGGYDPNGPGKLRDLGEAVNTNS